MKKCLCFLALFALISNVQADKDKKKKESQPSGKKPASAAVPSGGHMPGMPHTGGVAHNPGQSHSKAPSTDRHQQLPGAPSGNHAKPQSGSNPLTSKTSGATGTTRQNPLMRHGQANATGKANPTKANPLTQRNNQPNAKNPLKAGRGNPAGPKSAAQVDRNARQLNATNANHPRNFQNHSVNRGIAHATRANYHVRPYREVFHTYHPSHHNRVWYTSHYDRVVIVGGGYYYWDAGYWYPAWGYDPAFSLYVYDGPIYSYDNLPPDQVVVNVQTQLQDEGYYTGEVDGQVGPQTRDALGAFQADHNLEVTSAIDEPTVEALGLAETT